MNARRLSPILILLFVAFSFCASGLSFSQQRPGIQTSVVPPEGCFVDGSEDTEDLYSFIRVEIKALAFARDGEQADHDLLVAKGGPPIGQMAHLMAGLRQERIENACAGFVIAPFAKSENTYIASAAAYLVHAFDELGKMTDQMLRLSLMETIRQRAGLSTEDELNQLKNRRKELLDYMPLAVDASLALLLDSRLDADGKHDHLLLTAAQRDGLLNYLYARFPILKISMTGSDPGNFTQQVARIQSFLSGRYKPSDQ